MRALKWTFALVTTFTVGMGYGIWLSLLPSRRLPHAGGIGEPDFEEGAD